MSTYDEVLPTGKRLTDLTIEEVRFWANELPRFQDFHYRVVSFYQDLNEVAGQSGGKDETPISDIIEDEGIRKLL